MLQITQIFPNVQYKLQIKMHLFSRKIQSIRSLSLVCNSNFREKDMQDIIANNEYLNGNRTNSLINRKMIFRILGILLFIEGVMFLVCAGVSLCYKEHSYIYFIYSTLITAVAGTVLAFLGRKAENKLSRRDGYCIVAFTWLLFTLFGMLPFYLSGEIPSVSDAFFETMSGFTTTGATILDDIESLSYGMLFWRSFSQWIGGLGIVFLP